MDRALYPVIMDAYVAGVSTRSLPSRAHAKGAELQYRQTVKSKPSGSTS